MYGILTLVDAMLAVLALIATPLAGIRPAGRRLSHQRSPVSRRVRVRIVNRGMADHPFHLHGHRVRVLSRNGDPVTGSTWWTDTLNMRSGESMDQVAVER